MKKLLVLVALLFSIAIAQTNTSTTNTVATNQTNNITNVSPFSFDGGIGVNLTSADSKFFSEIVADTLFSYETNFAVDLRATTHLIILDDDVTFDGDVYTTIGYNFNKVLKLYLLAGIETKESMQLGYRIDAGLGGKITYVQKKPITGSISLIPLFNGESYLTDPGMKSVSRLSFRSKLNGTILGDNIKYLSVVYYKPNFADFTSFIIDSEQSIMVKVNTKLYLELKYLLDLDYNKQVALETVLHQVLVGVRIAL